MKVLCIGCSWTDEWPNFLSDSFNVEKISLHGKGLGAIIKELEIKLKRDEESEEKYGVVICQLPTPLRTFSGDSTMVAHRRFVQTLNQSLENPIEKLLTKYKTQISEINQLHSNVVFFLYNTGGYPLRHPFDFGEDIDNQFVKFFQESNMKHIYLSFEGKPGYCKQEEDCDDSEYKSFVEKNMKRILKINQKWRGMMAEKFWVWQHPENRVIYDPHPSKRADKLAAKAVEEYLNEDS
tara:strand:- start:3863 stop:4573 length:711 start_codon:yes stop_codon:yes gene_type:complete